MELTDDMIERANQCGSEERKRNPVATSARYDRRIGRVVIALSSGLELAFAPHLVQGLDKQTALLEGLLGSANWAASRMGSEGGMAKSPAKVAAARANGSKGGRPRKSVLVVA